MKGTRKYLAVIMDGVKDTNRMLDCAKAAKDEGDEPMANWFMQHANSRMMELKKDKNEVFEKIGLQQKAKSGDEIAKAFMEHVDDEVEKITARMSHMGK